MTVCYDDMQGTLGGVGDLLKFWFEKLQLNLAYRPKKQRCNFDNNFVFSCRNQVLCVNMFNTFFCFSEKGPFTTQTT